jgi:hypothetical protein
MWLLFSDINPGTFSRKKRPMPGPYSVVSSGQRPILLKFPLHSKQLQWGYVTSDSKREGCRRDKGCAVSFFTPHSWGFFSAAGMADNKTEGLLFLLLSFMSLLCVAQCGNVGAGARSGDRRMGHSHGFLKSDYLGSNPMMESTDLLSSYIIWRESLWYYSAQSSDTVFRYGRISRTTFLNS